MNNIAILGSTGSIGKTTLSIVRQNKKNFKIRLLSTNSNIKKIFNQAKEFKVKNVIILKKNINKTWKKKFKINKINIYNDFNIFKKIIKKKLDYVINGISGIDGLEPTLNIIKFTKKIAIANKESIICGWNLINNALLKYKTQFIPVDSEHFSIFQLIKNQNPNLIKKIIITASGGPFLKKKSFDKIRVKEALKHPTWKMGKKISIDSSTMMNKVFEVIEAKKIFKINIKKIEILINPNSYLHAIIIFNNGTIKILAHETKMDIPIYNSIYSYLSLRNYYKTKNLNINKINNLNLSKPDTKYFNSLRSLKLIPDKDSLFETILISVNDELVKLFLNKTIEFKKISIYLLKIINFKTFKKYCKIKPSSIKEILTARELAIKSVRNYVSKKI